MVIQANNVGPKLSEVDITQFEERIGYSLPKPYRAFLLKFNGGRPTPYHYGVPNWHYQKSLVNDFNGIIPGQYNNLEDDITLLEDRLPSGFIPIGDDPGGNRILLSLDEPTRGKVYFWDHENEPEESLDDVEDYPNIYLLADDFDKFLDNLRDEDESTTPDTSSS